MSICLLPCPEPAGSARAVLISQWVSGSLDPTWPPAQLLLMSASCCRLERVVFKQCPALGPPRGAHPLRSLKGPYSNSTSGCFWVSVFSPCVLLLFISVSHGWSCALYSSNSSWLCSTCYTGKKNVEAKQVKPMTADGWMPGLVRISCHAPLLSEWALWRRNRQRYETNS